MVNRRRLQVTDNDSAGGVVDNFDKQKVLRSKQSVLDVQARLTF